MAFSHGTPNSIVTDGLVFCVDPANKLSYPGSGTTWEDLINNNTGTLGATPTFDPSNSGIFDFDSTDVIDFEDIPQMETTSITVSFWVYFSTLSGNGSVIFNSGTFPNGFLIHSTSAASVWNKVYYSIGGTGNYITTNSAFITNKWYNFSITINNTTGILYLNGIAQGSSFTVGSTRSNLGDVPKLGQYKGGSSWPLLGSLSSVLIHNRALSASEVTQNYNALKNRFRT